MSALGAFAGALGGVANGDPLGGLASGAANDVAGAGLHAIGAWVLDGTEAALEQVASAIGAATAPNLDSTWFSSTYWRVAALAAMLTLPFLCAAAVQSLARADIGLLAKVVFGYLPLSVIGVSLAAPLAMLLLAATDQMSSVVSAGAATGGARFLDQAAASAATMSTLAGSPFFAVVVGLFAVMAALALALELLIRAAAVYVVMLMLPLAFAALVWPARRIWAVRLVELLVSLILSKFVIVAVLSLAGAAFAGSGSGVSQLLTAMALVLLSTFAPWALMRILPFTELAAGAAGMLRHELPQAGGRAVQSVPMANGVSEYVMTLPARLRRQSTEFDDGFTNGSGADGLAAAEPVGSRSAPASEAGVGDTADRAGAASAAGDGTAAALGSSAAVAPNVEPVAGAAVAPTVEPVAGPPVAPTVEPVAGPPPQAEQPPASERPGPVLPDYVTREEPASWVRDILPDAYGHDRPTDDEQPE